MIYQSQVFQLSWLFIRLCTFCVWALRRRVRTGIPLPAGSQSLGLHVLGLKIGGDDLISPTPARLAGCVWAFSATTALGHSTKKKSVPSVEVLHSFIFVFCLLNISVIEIKSVHHIFTLIYCNCGNIFCQWILSGNPLWYPYSSTLHVKTNAMLK